MSTAFVVRLLTGHGIALPLGAFLAIGAAIVAIAFRLARHADAIADATGLGRLWIGSVLLAASTSLPELTTDVGAALQGAVDIGVGDLLGSTLANMLIFAMLDLTRPRLRILDHVSTDHVLIGTLAVVLTSMFGAALLSGGWHSFGHVGLESMLILATYLLGMRTVYDGTRETAPPQQLSLGESSGSLLRRGLSGFALGALGLIVMAPLLVRAAEAVSIESGLSETFVGTLLVGWTTSLPEIATAVAAVRAGALDLAVGNLLGSNAFNMCILFAMDLADRHGPVAREAAHQNALSAALAALSTSLGVLAILARRSRRLGKIRIESLLIVLTYAGSVYLLLAGRGR